MDRVSPAPQEITDWSADLINELNEQTKVDGHEVLEGAKLPASSDPSRDVLSDSRRTTEDGELCMGDLNGFPEASSGHRPHGSTSHRASEERRSDDEFEARDKQLLLKTLIAAECAANAAAIQLVSFKDTLDHDMGHARCSRDHRVLRQRHLLLEKLEVFKRINSSVRQQLKVLQDEEASRLETNKDIDALLKKLAQAEKENERMRSHLCEKEKQVEELITLRKKEIESTESVVQLSRSVGATRAHLQSQLRNKEGDNNRLSVQLRGLERAIARQKLEMAELKSRIAVVTESSAQEKEALKKATRAQKHRAEKFEAAVKECHRQLREKDLKLEEAKADGDMCRSRHEKTTEERVQLDIEIKNLKDQVAAMTVELQRERDIASAANEVLLQKVEKLNTENAERGLDNAALKVSVAELEDKLHHSHVAFQEESALAEDRKRQVEDYQRQVAQLRVEVTDLKIQLETLLRETDLRERSDADITMEREELAGRVRELERYPALLSHSQRSLLDSQESLRRSELRHADAQQSLGQLQQTEKEKVEQLKSSLEMKDSISEANSRLQQQIDSLQRRMEEVQEENLGLVQRLAGQEEALQYGSRQLEQRTAENQALSRQLETSLSDIRQQVSNVKEKALSRENCLQARILELEKERSRRETQLKQLGQSKLSTEKRYEAQLRDLQLSLDQSESHKQSIENYVDFLKNSYATMFEEGLPSSFGSSYLLK